MPLIVAIAVYWLARFLAPRVRAWVAAWTGRDTSLTRLELASIRAREAAVEVQLPLEREPDPLCYACVYAHIVRGSKPEEEMIACGYAFPMRVVTFRVRECTDYRPKRERKRVEIANEGAACILPLDETATDFHAPAAARNGEGEVESSYD